MKTKTILLSHSASETKLARVLQKWIQSSLGAACKVETSLSTPRTSAQKRRQNVAKALESCSCCVVLAGRASLDDGWVQFEAGAAWHQGVPLLALCHTDLSRGDLPAPLSPQPSAETRRADFASAFLGHLSKLTGLPAPKDPEDILEEVRALERQVAPEASLDVLDNPHLTLLIDLGRRIVYPKKLEAAATIARETGGYEREVEKRLESLSAGGHLEKKVDKEGLARYRLKESTLAKLLEAEYIS